MEMSAFNTNAAMVGDLVLMAATHIVRQQSEVERT
jgi:hypothetical protein